MPARHSTKRPAPPRRDAGGRLSKTDWIVWLLLLILPGLAFSRLPDTTGMVAVAASLLLVSVVTWLLYRRDKNNAQRGLWRTPEATLHLAELAGGWITAFQAQRVFRHKIAKKSYQFVFWCIIAIHQYAAFDCLSGWRYSISLYRFVRAQF